MSDTASDDVGWRPRSTQRLDAEADVQERMAAIRADLRGTGQAALGVDRRAVGRSYRADLRRHGVSMYPVLVLGVLGIVDTFMGSALSILSPEVARTLGLSEGQIVYVQLAGSIVSVACPIAIAVLVQHRARRALLSIIAGVGWSVITLAAGFVTSATALTVLIMADSATTSTVKTVHGPLLLDNYPPAVRVRTLSAYQGIGLVGAIASPGLVALLTGPGDLTWRGTLLVLAGICMAASLFSLGLRDPGFGRFDTAKLEAEVRSAVAPLLPGGSAPAAADPAAVSTGEAFRRLVSIPTVRRFLGVNAVLGVMGIPLSTYFTFFLDQRWHLDPTRRALFFTAMPLFSIAAVLMTARYAEGLYRRAPGRLVRLLAVYLFGSLLLVGAAIEMPYFPLVVVCFGVSGALLVAIAPASSLAIMAVIEPRLRPHALALIGIASVGVGGIAGAMLLDGATQQLGQARGMLLVLGPGIAACYLLWTTARTVEPDLDRLVEHIVEAEQVRALAAAGSSLPLLSCRRLDYCYGSLQVLHGVDFAVADGEMVALLGTNGSGKTTLLRAIAGVGLPSGGTIRFAGADITFVDAAQRVRMGVSQVPGGQAVFAPLTVIENLRVYGYSHGRDRRAVERGIDASLAAFPRLAQRRNSLAATLSGGEQQMLALSKALILAPRLLCIDELSLGLAPKAVGELLQMVRRINAAGTAVVLVEQSVNIALTLVEHAYFMERGRIVFDGSAAELVTRPDLIRSVFLRGAAAALSTESGRIG